MKTIAAICCSLLLPGIVFAHHSRAEFSNQTEEITGELVSARWVNPHPELTLRVTTDDGATETLVVQVYGAANNLRVVGVTDELFEIGDEVTIAGQRSTRREGLVLGTHMLLADGRQAVFSRTLDPFWSNEAVGGRENFLAAAPDLADALNENRGLFRMWSNYPNPGDEGRTSYLPLTDVGEARKAAFDQENSWIVRREAPGMPAFMNSRNNFEFFDEGDTIRYEQGVFGVVRTIYLPESGGLDDPQVSQLGYSTGRWEGNTLVIETTHLNWPYVSRDGTPLSENVQLTERFTVSDDQTRLDYQLTIIDPEMFNEPATVDRQWVALANPTPDERYVR
ncbi:MAG: DUF6152 family protein [Candidatus Rariloculaceae bacterium]